MAFLMAIFARATFWARNAIYQKILTLANKEQRGYVTPQEFNLFADRAQNEIYENYFHQLNTHQIDHHLTYNRQLTACIEAQILEEEEIV